MHGRNCTACVTLACQVREAAVVRRWRQSPASRTTRLSGRAIKPVHCASHIGRPEHLASLQTFCVQERRAALRWTTAGIMVTRTQVRRLLYHGRLTGLILVCMDNTQESELFGEVSDQLHCLSP